MFDRIGTGIQEGTVIIFDELYNYAGWEEQEMKAFREFAIAEKIQVEYLGRTPSCQVSLRVTGRGRHVGATVWPCHWTQTGPGVGIRRAER